MRRSLISGTGAAKVTHCIVWDGINALYLSYPEHLFRSHKNMLVIFIMAKWFDVNKIAFFVPKKFLNGSNGDIFEV